MIYLFVFIQKNVDVRYCEVECFSIDFVNKKVNCRLIQNVDLNGKVEYFVDYDYFVIVIGVCFNIFNIFGVEENVYFLKVRRKCIISRCFILLIFFLYDYWYDCFFKVFFL